MERSYENKIESLLIDRSSSRAGSIIIANFTEAENSRSWLSVFAEIQSSDKDNDEIIKILTDDLHGNFKNSPAPILELAFEDALSKINVRLKDVLLSKPKNWLNKMHVLVVAIKDRDIHLSAVGEVHAFLIHREKMIDTIGSPQNKIINPLKLFSNVSSGSIASGQSLVIINEAILDYISPERIRKTANDYLPAQSVARLTELLDRAPANKKFGAIFIKRTRLEAGQAKEKDSSDGIRRIYTEPTGPIELPGAPGQAALAWLLKLQKGLKLSAGKIITFSLNGLSLSLEKSQKFLTFVLERGPSLPKLIKTLAANPEARKYYLARTTDSVRRQILHKFLMAKNRFAGLTKKQRYLISAIAALGLILLVSLIYKIDSQSGQKAKAELESLSAAIEQKISQGEASLIYKDTARAKQMLNEAGSLLKSFPQTEKDYREKFQQLNVRTIELLNRLENRKIIADWIPADQVPAQWQNQSAKIQAWGEKIVYLNAGLGIVALLKEKEEPLTDLALGQAGSFSETVLIDEKKLALLSSSKAAILDTAGGVKEREIFEYSAPQPTKHYAGYAANIYLLNASDEGAIIRYRKSARGFSSPQNWLKEKENLNSAIAMAVDGKIYLLLKENKIQIYSNGQKDSNLELTLSEPLKENASLYTTAQISNLYVFDEANKRIVAIEKTGKQQKQYQVQTDYQIASFAVSADEKNAFFLAGSQIYKFDLN